MFFDSDSKTAAIINRTNPPIKGIGCAWIFLAFGTSTNPVLNAKIRKKYNRTQVPKIATENSVKLFIKA